MEMEAQTTRVDESRILFAIGRDRPGIVREVAQYLTDRGANIEDSRMSAIGGLFSMTLLFRCNDEPMDAIADDTGVLVDAGLDYIFFDPPDIAKICPEGTVTFTLDVECMDHPGVVKEVVRVLHDGAADIESLDTEMIRAPFCGTPIFRLSAKAALPPSESLDELQRGMEELAVREGLDIAIAQMRDAESDQVVMKWAC